MLLKLTQIFGILCCTFIVHIQDTHVLYLIKHTLKTAIIFNCIKFSSAKNIIYLKYVGVYVGVRRFSIKI